MLLQITDIKERISEKPSCYVFIDLIAELQSFLRSDNLLENILSVLEHLVQDDGVLPPFLCCFDMEVQADG